MVTEPIVPVFLFNGQIGNQGNGSLEAQELKSLLTWMFLEKMLTNTMTLFILKMAPELLVMELSFNGQTGSLKACINYMILTMLLNNLPLN